MSIKTNRLAQPVRVGWLLGFAAPTAVMMVFTSLYQMVDGVFVSRIVGEGGLSALNITYPVPSAIIALSIMLATGGSAIVAKTMGQGQPRRACQDFSLIVWVGVLAGVLVGAAGLVWLKPLVKLLGSTPGLNLYCRQYLVCILACAPLLVLQMLFSVFFVTAGAPKIGLGVTAAGGITNIVLDAMLVPHLGVLGAGIATGAGYAVAALAGLVFFAANRRGSLYFVRPAWHKGVLWHSCTNGASEMINNMAVSITTFLLNQSMLKYAGEDGVAAITIVLYAQFLMTSVFMGFSSGVAPVISYHYGAKNHDQLRRAVSISLWAVGIGSVLVVLAGAVLVGPIVGVFSPKGSSVYAMAKHGFYLFLVAFLASGVNLFASALFTALSNGKTSAMLSFLRTLVFIVLGLALWPALWGLTGVWLAIPLAEAGALLVSVACLVWYKRDFGW